MSDVPIKYLFIKARGFFYGLDNLNQINRTN